MTVILTHFSQILTYLNPIWINQHFLNYQYYHIINAHIFNFCAVCTFEPYTLTSLNQLLQPKSDIDALVNKALENYFVVIAETTQFQQYFPEVAQSCPTVTSWTYQAPPSVGFSRQEYWSGLPFPSPWDLPNPGLEPTSPTLAGDWQILYNWATREAQHT